MHCGEIQCVLNEDQCIFWITKRGFKISIMGFYFSASFNLQPTDQFLVGGLCILEAFIQRAYRFNFF